MNKVGMLTGGVINGNNIEEGYRQLAEAGFKPHLDAAIKCGLTFRQPHAPFPSMIKGREDINEKLIPEELNLSALRRTADIGKYFAKRIAE